MSYQALYRAWRPQTFHDLMGQPHVKQTLMNAIERGQVAHAYLFCGPRGTGKTTAAKILAKAVNCLSPDGVEPCNHCSACESINSGNSVDVEEIDAASNRGVDEIRQLRDKVQYSPAALRRKVYIVDEVHMLTTEAFNALLKTLEEPPAHALFVLATTEPHKIPGTIISRCQRFDFRRITEEVIAERLRQVCDAKQWTYDEEALWKIAEAADGGLRDALGILEQAAAFGSGHLTAEHAAHVAGGVATSDLLTLIRDLVQQDFLPALQKLMDWYAEGKDPQRIVQELLQRLRDLFIVKLSPADSPLAQRQGYAEVASLCPTEWLLTAVQKLGETYVNLRFVDQPRLALEAALMGLVPAGGTAGGETTGIANEVSASAPQTSRPAAERNPGPSNLASRRAARPAAAADPTPSTPTASAKPKAKPALGRKMEVLQRLHQAADEQQKAAIRGQWDAILQDVKQRRIQAHAWLINGDVVLVTPDTVVLSFSSRIHRDAVMKPDEREAIEAAFRDVVGQEVQVFALLQADWDAFQQTLEEPELAATAEPSGTADDIVERAKQLFPEDRIEIRTEE